MTPRERFAPIAAELSFVMDPLSERFMRIVREAEKAIADAIMNERGRLCLAVTGMIEEKQDLETIKCFLSAIMKANP